MYIAVPWTANRFTADYSTTTKRTTESFQMEAGMAKDSNGVA